MAIAKFRSQAAERNGNDIKTIRKKMQRKEEEQLSFPHPSSPNNGLEASVNKSEAPHLSVNGGRNRNEDHIFRVAIEIGRKGKQKELG